MKTPLRVSILFNAILLGALGFAMVYRPKPTATVLVPQVNSEPEVALPTLEPFHWSQLESSNSYRAYVANLRAIGCPEPTIRAIVTADFEAAAKFMQHKTEIAGESNSRFTLETMEQTVANVLAETNLSARVEETSGASSIVIENSSAQPVALQMAAPIASRSSYPVLFQNPVLNDSSLKPAQKAALQQMQHQFVDAVGGPNQNPSDPAYAGRWQTAQQDADDALRAQLGNQAYLSYKLQHYYSNFKPVMLQAGAGPVTINPDELAK